MYNLKFTHNIITISDKGEKMLKKIILIMTIFLIIGSTYATDVDNLQVPDGWESIGSGSYHEISDSPGAGSGRNMMIQKWYDGLKNEYYSNITDEHYYVYDNGDNTFNYTDGLNEDYGCFEVVELDGERYFVIFWNVVDADFDSVDVSTYDLLMEFNKLNNLEPVSV